MTILLLLALLATFVLLVASATMGAWVVLLFAFGSALVLPEHVLHRRR